MRWGVNARRSLAAALALLFLAGCSGSSSPTAEPSTTPVPTDTVWQQAIANTDSNGQYSLQAALDLFATAYGPLPGSTAEQNLGGEEVVDGNVAIAAVMSHASELTQEQRSAIDAYLAPPSDADVITVPPVNGATGLLALAGAGDFVAAIDSNTKKAYEDAAKEFRSQIASKLGRDIVGDLKVFFKDEPGPLTKYGGRAMADAWSDWPGGTFGDCHIRIFKDGQAGEPIQLLAVLAHETFHCFQLDAFRTIDSYAIEPPWVVEGQATWVEASMSPGVDCCDAPWNQWLIRGDSLTKRAYSAIGFYAHLAEMGTDPWSVFQKMWEAGSDHVQIFNQAGANNDPFLDSWASSVLRDPSRSRAWDTTGPDITDTSFSPPSFVLKDKGSVDLSAPFFETEIRFINLEVDAVQFQYEGHLRLSDGTLDTTDFDGRWYCVAGRDCTDKCETDDEEPPPIDGTIGYVIAVASTGGVDGTIGKATGIKLKEECETPSPSRPPLTPRPLPPADPCDNDCPMSNGDVHIVPIEGQSWDFQAVGEFVLLRTADGSFEVQARQEPYSGSDHVSVNTAIAMRVGDHRIGVYGDPANSDKLTIMVDGTDVDPTADPVSVADAVITYVDGIFPAYEVALGDGTRVSLAGQVQYGINLTINPSGSFGDGAVGLMGPIPPDSMGVPALPDGAILPLQGSLDDYNNALYGIFEDSWRVTGATSLFDYADGKTTESYINADFPALEEVLTLADLTPEQIAAGEAACASVVIEMLHDQCVYDVAVTGVNAFGDLYDLSAEIVDRGTIVPAGQRVRVVNLFCDPVTGAVPMDVYAWTDAGAALVTTVEYGQTTKFFDPGMRTATFGGDALVSLQPAGEPVQEEAFNFVDLRMDIEPGLERTYVVGTGGPDPFFGNQVRPTIDDFDEKGGFYPLMQSPPGTGLLFLSVNSLVHTHDPVDFYLSAGEGCMTQPGFAGLAQTSGVGDNSFGYQGPLEVTPGDNLELTLHALPPNDDPFAQKCDSAPIAGPWPFTLEAGQRAHLILYAIPGDPTIRSIILPFGDS